MGTITRISTHRRHEQVRITGARRHWFCVRGGSIWRRYDDDQWQVVHREHILQLADSFAAQRREAIRAKDTVKAVRLAEHLMDLEAAILVQTEILARAGGDAA